MEHPPPANHVEENNMDCHRSLMLFVRSLEGNYSTCKMPRFIAQNERNVLLDIQQLRKVFPFLQV